MKIKQTFISISRPVLYCLLCVVLFTSCAAVQPQIADCINGHQYGFWGGLWHGFIAPFSFIVSLFSDNIAVWAINNNGSWYTFGFLIGVGSLFGGGASSVR